MSYLQLNKRVALLLNLLYLKALLFIWFSPFIMLGRFSGGTEPWLPQLGQADGPWADLGEWRNHFPAWIWCKLWILKTFSGHFHFITDNLAVSIRADTDAQQTEVAPLQLQGGGSPPLPIYPRSLKAVLSDTDFQWQQLTRFHQQDTPHSLMNTGADLGERVQVPRICLKPAASPLCIKRPRFSVHVCLKIKVFN